MKVTSLRLFMLVKRFHFYYEETFNSLFSVKNTFRSQPPQPQSCIWFYFYFNRTTTNFLQPKSTYCSTLYTINHTGEPTRRKKSHYFYSLWGTRRYGPSILHSQSSVWGTSFRITVCLSSLWWKLIPCKIDLARQQFSAPPEPQMEYSAKYPKSKPLRWGLIFIHLLRFATSIFIIPRPAYTMDANSDPEDSLQYSISINKSPGQLDRIKLAHNIFSYILLENQK